MSQPPAFQFYASDYLSSSRVQRMSLEEEGAYIRLLCYNWQDGSIPDDTVQLAALCKIPVRRMAKNWGKIACCISPADANSHRLINKKLEQVRAVQAVYSAKQSARSKEGWSKRHDAAAMPRHMPRLSRSDASMHASGYALQSSIGENPTIQDSPPKKENPKKQGSLSRPRDPAMDTFCEEALRLTGAPYIIAVKDGVHLSQLRKAYGIGTMDTPPHWSEAIQNYYGSPLSSWTMADMVVRYSVFSNSPLDHYKNPINHGGNGNGKRESETQARERRTNESAESFYRRVDEKISGGVPAGDQRADPGDVFARTGRPYDGSA